MKENEENEDSEAIFEVLRKRSLQIIERNCDGAVLNREIHFFWIKSADI